ncbi:MAG TPA: succinate dehydrogenase [Xanthobacteraceae bacterium]|jgi:fumarate reductase subunit C|nr:succinate dehydrogenase [Xanthobacteraceae bacterium]
MNVRLFLWQRGTAALMLPLIAVHLGMIFYATRHGMTATDILRRTQGSLLWASYYGLFVTLASIHAAIGVRNILIEWIALTDREARRGAILFGIVLLVLGLRAVAAVVLS